MVIHFKYRSVMVWRFLKLKTELPYDPPKPLLGIYPEETIIRNSIHIPMFTAALFTTARTWKQAKCPLTEEWIKKMWYIYAMEHCSAIKKNEIVPSAVTWMDLDIVILSEVSQEEKDKYMTLLMCGIKKKAQINLFTKQKLSHRCRKQICGIQGGNDGGGINWEIGVDIYTLIYIEFCQEKALVIANTLFQPHKRRLYT